jgi:hypothetical protein
VDHKGSIKLLSTILADIPRLPGANCTGKHASASCCVLRWLPRGPTLPERDYRGRHRTHDFKLKRPDVLDVPASLSLRSP